MVDEWLRLRSKRAVVTGGGRGIGASIAEHLARVGCRVLVADREADAAIDVASRIGGHSARVDVGDPSSVVDLAEGARGSLGGIDVWVNNAGIYPVSPALDMELSEWQQVLDVNLTGTFIGAREAARAMTASGSGGVIVNLASAAGVGGRGPAIAHYVATKHAVVGLTKQLALEFAPAGIRVLAVAPSRVDTPGVSEALAQQATPRPVEPAPLGRVAQPDDVARVVLFCASDLARFMTGSTLLVDGGELAR